MDVRGFTVGPVQENTWIARRDGATNALLIDPGDEAERLLQAVEALEVTIDAILITHTHFDHVGAVAPMARATGAPVYCPAGEVEWLKEIPHVPGLRPVRGLHARAHRRPAATRWSSPASRSTSSPRPATARTT